MKNKKNFCEKLASSLLTRVLIDLSSYISVATALTSVAQLRRTFIAKVFVGDRMTGGIKRNMSEMRLSAIALKGGT